MPLAWWASQLTRFETLNRSMKSYFSQHRAWTFLLLIVLYKLGDAFAGALLTPFLLKAAGFAPAEVGVVNKIFGMWLTIGGILAGGALMVRLGLYRALLWFGVLQLAIQLRFLAGGHFHQGSVGRLRTASLQLGDRDAEGGHPHRLISSSP